jgi:hypothetical protein
MKKSIELYVDLYNADVLYGVGISVEFDNDSVSIVVGNDGDVLDATTYSYKELGIEVKELPSKKAKTKE